MHLNTYLTHEGTRYEIYWTTQAAQHILENYVADQTGGVHQGLDHRMVSQLLKRACYVIPVSSDPRPYYHISSLVGPGAYTKRMYILCQNWMPARRIAW